MERTVKEKMTTFLEIEFSYASRSYVRNPSLHLKDFSLPIISILDQPTLSKLHKRRVSALGPGG